MPAVCIAPKVKGDLLPMWQYVVPASMLALLLVGGCAKTTVMQQQSYEGPRLAKPARILVYDFAAHASDLPAGYATVVAAPPVDQSSDDLSLGRELEALVAKNLVGELQKMGRPAVRAAGETLWSRAAPGKADRRRPRRP